MSVVNCTPYITCDNQNGAKSDSQLFRELIEEGENGCPQLRVSGSSSGGSGGPFPAALTGSGNFKVAIQEALPAGNNNIGDVDVASIAAGSNIIGRVGIDQTTPGTTNNVSVSYIAGTQAARSTALTNTAYTIRASAGRITHLMVNNPGSVTVKLAFYDNAAPTVGTTTIVATRWIAPGAMIIFSESDMQYAYTTAIKVAAVTAAAGAYSTSDSDNTAPAVLLTIEAQSK